MALRFDLVFSYWIYVWVIIYFLNYTEYSPKFALTLGLLDNIVMLFLMILWSTSLKTIIWFIIINVSDDKMLVDNRIIPISGLFFVRY